MKLSWPVLSYSTFGAELLSFRLPPSVLLFDAGGVYRLYALLIFAFVFFGPVTVLEAIALWALKWDGFWRAWLDSFLSNLISTVAGVLLFGAATILGVRPQTRFALALTVALAFVSSVVIEGLILLALRRRPKRETWRAALLANLFSYAVVIVTMLLLARAGR